MRKRVSDQRFREMVTRLTALCPPYKGTRVVFKRVSAAHLGDAQGTCDKVGRTFEIEIARGMDEDQTEERMIHEYAHALDWRPYQPLILDHGPTWGVEYARIYCAMKGCT